MTNKKPSTRKHLLKFISGCKDKGLIRQILKRVDKPTTKSICNCAYNLTNGEISLSPNQKRLFSKHRRVLHTLVSKSQSLSQKQKRIQKGGAAVLAAILPAILSAVLGSIGSSIFQK